MSQHQTHNTKETRLTIDGTNYRKAAGTTDTLVSDAVDMQGFEGVIARLLVGTLTASAVTDLRATGCATSGGSYADLAGTKVSLTASTDDNKVAKLEIVNPPYRFLKFVTTRATANAVLDGLFITQYGARKGVVADDSTTIKGSELHISPAAGTA